MQKLQYSTIHEKEGDEMEGRWMEVTNQQEATV